MATAPVRARDRYDLAPDDLAALGDQLSQRYGSLLSKAGERGSPALAIGVDGRDPLSDIGRVLEQRVFDAEAGDHSVDVMHSEYGSYEDRSMFFLAVDTASHSVVGSSRAITGTVGFGPMVKTMRDVLYVNAYSEEFIDLRDGATATDPEVGLIGRHRNPDGGQLDRRFLEHFHAMAPGETIIDMATVVVPAEVRAGPHGFQLSQLLYAAAWRSAELLDADHAVTFIRSDLLDVFRGPLGMTWEDLGGFGGTQYVAGDPFLSQPAYIRCNSLRATLRGELGRREADRPSKNGRAFEQFVDLMASESLSHLFLL